MEMITPLGDHAVVEKQTITMECEVSKPDRKAMWYKGKKLLKPDKRFEMKVYHVFIDFWKTFCRQWYFFGKLVLAYLKQCLRICDYLSFNDWIVVR